MLMFSVCMQSDEPAVIAEVLHVEADGCEHQILNASLLGCWVSFPGYKALTIITYRKRVYNKHFNVVA